MTTYTPPAEAAEAACRAVHPTRWEHSAIAHPCEECTTAVTAAGPFIAAQALRDAAQDVRLCWTGSTNLRDQDDSERFYSFDAWLDVRAARIARGEGQWEYGVKWGDEPDDSRPAICESREHAESRAAASHGDKVVRRTPARTIPAGEWEEVPRD